MTALPDRTKVALHDLQASLAAAFKLSNCPALVKSATSLVDRIWSVGPKKCGTNILLNMSDFEHQSFWQHAKKETKSSDATENDVRNEVESSFLNGFQMATLAGPLCEEPMNGVCFVVEQWTIEVSREETATAAQTYGPFSGQIMSTVKEGCRKAFQNQPQRLVTPMYSCNIVVSADVLGE